MDKFYALGIVVVIALALGLAFYGGFVTGEKHYADNHPAMPLDSTIHTTVPVTPTAPIHVEAPAKKKIRKPKPTEPIVPELTVAYIDSIIQSTVRYGDHVGDTLVVADTVHAEYIAEMNWFMLDIRKGKMTIPHEVEVKTSLVPLYVPEYHVDWKAVGIISGVATILTVLAIR